MTTRKRVKSETKAKKIEQAIDEEAMTELEDQLEPDELRSFEEEFEDEIEADEAPDDGGLDEEAAALDEDVDEDEEIMEMVAAADVEEVGDEDFEDFEEAADMGAPPRRETRQEMLGRLMGRLLGDRERVHQALERVRDLKMQLDDAGPRPPDKLKEQYQKAVSDLSRARRDENFARSELMQVLSWRG